MSTTGEHERGLVVLSLDGGGIRGLSSLLILQEIMTRLQHQLGLDRRPEVYEFFDIVGGTGTGGISAVMLGRLRMPLSRAIDHFAKLGEDVFSNNSFFRASNSDRSAKMKQALKRIIRETTGNENEKMMDNLPETERCNTVVFAMSMHNMNGGRPRAFRSYQAWINQMFDCAIWEALSATTAYPDLFESVNFGDGSLKQPFVGGCLGCNNPLPHILAEVKLMYPDRHVACVISIGAGHAETIQFPTPSSFGSFLPGNVIKTMKDIAMDGERDNQQMAKRFSEGKDVYFRLNVDQGMQNVELCNWERLGEVVAHTQGYMQHQEVTQTIDRSAKAIKDRKCVFHAIHIDGQLPVPSDQPREEQIVHRTLQMRLDIERLVQFGQDTRLDRLSPAKDAWYNSALSADMTKRRECTANTRTQVLTDAHAWTQDDKGAKIYWMNGMAGTGKTTIAYSLCKRLEADKQLGANFFCSRDSPTCRDVTKLVPTIAYQLGRFSKLYNQAVCNVLSEDPDVVHKDVQTQFLKLIAEPLGPLKKATATDAVVVIDALDECADVDGPKKVLDLLFRHARELPINFFVTSRPEPKIVSTITQQDPNYRSILHLHNIEQSVVGADIRTYLIEELKPINPLPEQIERLVARAGRLFIFAATVVRYISPDDPSADHEERLSAMLETSSDEADYDDIDALYEKILSKILVGGKPKGNERTIRRLVLWTVVCAREPMTMAALAEVLGLNNKRKVEVAIQPLRSVLHVSESTEVVSTLHASFPDFLLSEARAGSLLYCHETKHNEHLATRCFEIMKQSLRFNICGLESSFRFDKDVPDIGVRADSCISQGLLYACLYWGDHLSGVATRNIFGPHVDEFLRHRLLFWMEALNLKGRIGHGEGILSQVLGWLSTDNTLTELQQFTYDARNFVTTFAGNPTSLSTPHIYMSVLPFTSKQSHVRTNYWPRTRGLLRVEGTGMEARGTVALATWKVGSGVKSIAQSGDGRRIVSGCNDGAVSIWDISNGARIVGPLKSDKDQGEVGGVAFSSDGTHIASTSGLSARRTRLFWSDSPGSQPDSQGGTICIWDAHNGNLITDPLKGHTKPIDILSVAFSRDGTRLVSGSKDRTIRMWDARNGNPLGNPFQGHQGWVLSVVFSPDGKRIASGSHDRTIRIWDVRSATTIVGPLEGHTDRVRSVAFSPDGLCVVSGSEDNTVRVWDLQSGTIMAGALRGHTKPVMSVAFSPDGMRVVSGSGDRTIRIWDAQNGTLIALLGGHRGSVNSVLFSTDGTRILSGSDDGTICVWDARHRTTAAATSSGHTDKILSVVFSPDGTRLVSGSADRTIRVWDTRNGRLVVGPLEGHAHEVNLVAFSPDGAQIVSGSKDRTIRTWDARSGALIGVPFEGHTCSVWSVAYSPDGRRIASGSSDRTIKVWNSQTGNLAAEPFMGHTKLVVSVAWSPDGTRIVSGSYDQTVRMWHAHDGTALWTSKAHTHFVNCVAFSLNGTRVVSGSFRTILVLNADDGEVHGRFKDVTSSVLSVAFSPDGTRVVSSGSYDHTVCVWDAQNSMLVSRPFEGHTDWVTAVAISPGGRGVVSCSYDKTIRFWDIATADKPPPSYFGRCTIRDDGWVVHSNSQLLMWLPPNLRAGFLLPGAYSKSGIIDHERALLVDYSDLLVGERWKECYLDSAAGTMA